MKCWSLLSPFGWYCLLWNGAVLLPSFLRVLLLSLLGSSPVSDADSPLLLGGDAASLPPCCWWCFPPSLLLGRGCFFRENKQHPKDAGGGSHAAPPEGNEGEAPPPTKGKDNAAPPKRGKETMQPHTGGGWEKRGVGRGGRHHFSALQFDLIQFSYKYVI